MTAISAARPPILLARLRPPLSGRYLLGRLATGALAVWGAITVVFVALYSTANPALLLISPDAPPDEIDRLNALYGFDQPVIVQYARFIGSVLTGTFPPSLRYGSDPLAIALDRVPASLALGAVALILGVVLGGIIGWVSATARSGAARTVPLAVATALDAVPTFFFGILAIFVFAVWLRWLPAVSSGGPVGIILPAITLAVAFVPTIARVFRTSLAETLHADHVRTARSKGLPDRVVAIRHVAGNSFGTTLSVVGVQAGVLLGGAVVTESVFSWPGVGQLSINAVQNLDYPLVIACVLVISVGFVLISLVVDTLAAILEPRLRT